MQLISAKIAENGATNLRKPAGRGSLPERILVAIGIDLG
jgi:hypothetical protein